MTTVTECVICGGPLHTRRQALVAPFLAKRIWGRKPFQVALVECRDCGFLFYNPRMEPEEEARLYANYRSAEYLKMRNEVEPWYTPSFNQSLSEPGLYDKRRTIVAALLRKHLGTRKVTRILDYGGDGGMLVKGLVPGATPFVYDISGAPAVDGVSSTNDPKRCQADLIVNSNVLEHVSFPRRLVSEILDSTPTGGLVFLEAPSEFPMGAARMARRVAQVGWTCLARPGLAPSILRPASLFMMHEHINYYTERSLTELIRRSDCTLQSAGSYTLSSPSGKAAVAWALAARSR